jgi:hypothetical protein
MYVLRLCKHSSYWAIIINEFFSPLWCVGSRKTKVRAQKSLNFHNVDNVKKHLNLNFAFSIKYIRVKTGCLRIRIMCLSVETCLPMNCCSSEELCLQSLRTYIFFTYNTLGSHINTMECCLPEI